MSNREPRIPLHLRRPPWLNSMIDRVQDEAQTYLPAAVYREDYPIVGHQTGPTRASDLLTTERLRILDIGAGYGGFVHYAQQLGHTAHALSLYDYRDSMENSTARQLKPGTYIVGNPDRLSSVNGLLGQYDVIVSDHGIADAVDPLGALEQALKKLAPRGVLAANGISPGYNQSPGNRSMWDVNSKLIYNELMVMNIVFTMADSARDRGRDNSFDLQAHYPALSGIAIKTAFRFDYEKLSNGWAYAPDGYAEDRKFLDTPPK